MQGLLSRDIRRAQDIYYRANKVSIKFNSTRWTKYVIKSLVEFSHDIWQERCTIVSAATNEVHEKRLRAEAWVRYQELKRDIRKIPSICRDLVRRDKKFLYDGTDSSN